MSIMRFANLQKRVVPSFISALLVFTLIPVAAFPEMSYADEKSEFDDIVLVEAPVLSDAGALNEAVLDASAEDAAKLQAVIDARAESLAALQEDSGEDGYYSSNLPQSVSDNAGNGYYQNEAANSTTDIEEIVEQAPTSIVPDIDFSDIESAAASISSVSTSDAEIDIDMSGLIDIAPSAALADSYKAAQADMDELSGGGDKPLVSLDLLSLFSETDDVEAEIPSEADGNKIMSITTRWLTQDQFDGKDDSRLNLRPTGSTFSVKAQIDTQLSGQHEYAVGDIQITIPKSVFADRNGNSLGRYSFSVPAAPDNRAQFAYSEFSDYFVLVNTKVIPAATSMRFEFSINNISSSAVNGNHTDLSDEVGKNPTSPLDVTISVTTHKGTLIQMKSDSIDAIIDTSAQVTSASVVTQNVSEVWDTSYPASLRPDNDEDYIYIHWQAWCYVSGFQWAQSLTFSTELSGDGQGVILGASLPNGKIVRPGDENTTGNSVGSNTPAKLSPISLYDNYYIGTGTRAYVNIYAAYLKSELPVEKDKTKPQPNYQMSNRVEYTLTSLDDKQITVAGDTEVEHYSPIEFPDPEGHFNVFKYGGNSYPHALNNLSRHKDQEVEFRVMTVGFGMPWTAEEDTVPTSLEDYGKREYKMITEDYATQFNHCSDDLTETDFEFSALRFVAPQTYEYKRFTSSGYAYTERNGVVTQQWVNAGGYGYVPSSGKNLTFTVYGRMAGLSDEWIPYATVKFTGGVSSITPLVNGVSQLGNTVVFPPMTTDYKVEISTSEPAVIYNMYPTVKVKASNSIINQVNALFDGSDIPETYVRNWAKSSNYVTGADGKYDEHIVDCGPKAADDTLRGVGTAATLSKTCSYENDEALGQVKFRYTATAEIASNITELDEYNQAVREGLITRETHGVFYDLLPEGVEPDTTSVTTRKNDVIESVETYPNWRGSNRTMMIVNVSETPTPVYSYSTPMKKSGYADKPSISFNAYMPWEMLYKYGNSVRNIVAYESGNDKIGTVKSFIGEPDDPQAGYNSASISAVSGAIDYMDDLNPDRDTQSFLYASCTTNAEVNTSSIAHISKKVSANNSGVYTDGLSNEYPANVAEGGVYNYLVSMTATTGTVERDIVFYDNLENYIPTAKDDKDDDGDVQWRGRLTSIDTTMLACEGIAPKVYYSTREGLVLDKTENTSDRDLSNSDIWKEYSDDLSDDVKAQIQAIAVDASTMQNGEDYDLSGGSTIGFKVNMIAPTAKALAMRDGVAESEITKEIKDRYYDTDLTNEQTEGDDNGFAGGAHAYNSIIMDSTHVDPISGVETPDQLVWFTYTKVGLFQQPVEIRKTWNDDVNNDGLRPDSIIVDVKNGKADEIVKSVRLSAAGGWKATLDDLDIYDSDGNIIDYDISERVDAPEIDISENYTLAVSKGSFGQSYTITLQNTHVPENVEFRGKKIWAGENGNAAARPQTVKIDLYSNGEFFGTYDVDVSGDGSEVEYVIGDLPKYTNGVLNVYSAKENIASAYEDDNYYAKSFDESTGTLVNEYYPYGSLKIEKKINNKNADKIGYQQKFKFQVEFIDKETGAPDADEMNYRIYSIDGNSISDELSLASGENIELAGNEYALFDKIPTSDKYRVSEVDIPIGWYVQGSDTVEGALTAHSMKTATFENRYIAGGSFPISIRKSLVGQQLRARTFTFVMKDENGRVISTARNDVNGIVDFGMKSFTEDNIGDEHKYYISELHENDGVYNYVDDVLEIVLNIKDAGAGELNITPAFNIIADNSGNNGGDSQIELIDTDNDRNDDKDKNAAIANFTNIYDPQGSIQLKAFKRLEGGELHDGQFEFVLNLVDTDGNTIEEKGRTFNDADGNIVFPELKYSAADNGKEYRYKITEIPSDDNGFVYSEQEFFYNVKVYDGYDGKMYYTTQVEDNADLTFVNEAKPGELVIEKLVDENSGDYDANTEFEFEVKLDGPNISDGQFSYELDEYGEKKMAFAVYSETDNSLMFYRRPVSQIPYDGDTYNGKVATNVYLNVDTMKYLSNPSDVNSKLTAPWIEEHQNDIQHVVCIDSISTVYMAQWFSLPNCVDFNLTHIDTSNCIDMTSLFENAKSVQKIDISTWNMKNVTNLNDMFKDCEQIDTVFMGTGWKSDFSKLVNMPQTEWQNLAYLGWVSGNGETVADFSSVVDFQSTLRSPLEWHREYDNRIAIGKTKSTTNSKEYGFIFDFPRYLIGASDEFNSIKYELVEIIKVSPDQYVKMITDNLTTSEYVTHLDFRRPTELPEDSSYFFSSIFSKNMYIQKGILNCDNIRTSHVTNMEGLFAGCRYIGTIKLSSFDTSNVTNMSKMFSGFIGTIAGNKVDFDTNNVKDMSYMFSNSHITDADSTRFVNLDVSKLNTSNVINMSHMFYNTQEGFFVSNLNSLSWNTSKVEDMSYMFACGTSSYVEKAESSNNKLKLDFNTSSLKDMSYMFYRTNVGALDISTFETGRVTSMDYCFNTPALYQISLGVNFHFPSSVDSLFQDINAPGNSESILSVTTTLYNKYADKWYHTSKKTEVTNSSFASSWNPLTMSGTWKRTNDQSAACFVYTLYESSITYQFLVFDKRTNINNKCTPITYKNNQYKLKCIYDNIEEFDGFAPWRNSSIRTSVVSADFKTDVTPKDCSLWFYIETKSGNIINISISTINKLHITSKCQGISSMFRVKNENLKVRVPEIDFSLWDTSNIPFSQKASFEKQFSFTTSQKAAFDLLKWKTETNTFSLSNTSLSPQIISDDIVSHENEHNNYYSITYAANGGTFPNGAESNIITYHETITPQIKYSHTNNIDDQGNRNGDYDNNYSSKHTPDIVTIPGAKSLHITVDYATESTSYDWLYILKGAHSTYPTDTIIQESAINQNKLGGGTNTISRVEYDVEGDSVTFAFRSDGSVGGYGYYAVVTGNGIDYQLDGEYFEPTSEHAFIGWSETCDSNILVSPNEIHENKTLYAVWDYISESIHDITYQATGGTFSNGTDKNIVSIKEKRNRNSKISKTSNIDLNGTKTSSYPLNQELLDVVTVPGASSLLVTIKYSTNNSSSWVSLYSPDVQPSESNYDESLSGKLYSNEETKTYTVEGDTVQFFFHSDNMTPPYSRNYGYYAVIEDIGTKEIISGNYEEPHRNGVALYGWGTSEDGEKRILNYEPLTIEHNTVFALWDETRSYDFTVTYDANGGIFQSGNELMDVTRTRIKKPYKECSHSPNLDSDGNKQENYANNLNLTDVVTIPGAKKLHVTITCSGESTSYDWTCVWAGAHYTYKPSSNYDSSISQKLGGSRKTYEYDIDGDSVTFGFKTDSSGSGDGYGYYAVVEDAGYVLSDNSVDSSIISEVPLYGWSYVPNRYYAIDEDALSSGQTVYASYIQQSGTSGTCCWDIDFNGTLNIYPNLGASSGTLGTDYTIEIGTKTYNSGAWEQYRDLIRGVHICDGISLPNDSYALVPGTKIEKIQTDSLNINIFNLLIASDYDEKTIYCNNDGTQIDIISRLSSNWNNMPDEAKTSAWTLENNNSYIEYSGNGGEGIPYLTKWSNDTLRYKIEKNIFDMEGYNFIGYSTKRLASVRDTIYQPGDMLPLSMKPSIGNTLTLYAQWERIIDNIHEGNIEDGIMRFTMCAGEKITIKDLPAGTTYRITEVNLKSGWSAVSDKTINATGVIPAGNQATATFTNTYQSGKITVPLSGIKFLDGEPATSHTPFEFQLERLANATDNAGEPVGRTTSGVGGAFSFEGLEFSEAGTYNYIIREIVPDDASGILYDGHVERITIVVSADNNNMLSSTVTYMDEGEGIDGKPQEQDNQIAFYNKTDTTPANLRITKNLDEPFSTPVTFSFRAVFDNPAIEDRVFSLTMPANTTSSNVSFNDFPIGERFTIVEENTPGFVLVSSENDILTLSYGKDYETSFTNRRDVSGTFALEAQKVMHDRKLNGGEFAFAVFDSVEKAMMAQESGNTDGAIQVSVNAPDLENKVYFDALSVTRPGAYDYYIVEIPNAGDTKDKNIVYDSSIYKAHVIVSDTGDTALECKVSYEKVGDANNIGGAVFDNHLKNGKLVVSKEVIGNDDCTSMFSIQFSFEQYDADGKLIEGSEYAWRSKTNENRNGYVSDKGVIEISKDEEIEIELPIGTIYNFVELDAIGYKLSSYENEKGTIADSDTVYAKIVNEYAPTGAVEVEFEKIADGFDLAGGMFSFVILDEDGQVVTISKNDAAGHISFSLEYDKSDLNENGDVQRTYLVFEQKDDMKDIRFDDSLYNINVVLHDNKDGEIVTHAYVMDSATGQKVDNVQFVNVKRKPVSLPLSGEIGIAGLSIAGMFLVIVGLYLFSRPMIRKEKHDRTRR